MSTNRNHSTNTTTITGWVHALKSDVGGMLDQFRSENATSAAADARSRAKFVEQVSRRVQEVRADVNDFVGELSRQRSDNAADQSEQLRDFCSGLEQWVTDLHKASSRTRAAATKAHRAATAADARKRYDFVTELNDWSEGFKKDVAAFEKSLRKTRVSTSKANAAARDGFISELKSDVGSMLDGFAKDRASIRKNVLGIAGAIGGGRSARARTASTPAVAAPKPRPAVQPEPAADSPGSPGGYGGVDYRAELRRRAGEPSRVAGNRRKAG
jgi:soluble cytochrome b562